MIRRLLRHEAGGVFTIVALSIVVLVSAVGSAVDAGRGYIVQAKLQNALDAAGLAAGASGSTDEAVLTAIVNKYINANFNNGTLGATITGTTTTLSEDDLVITVNSYATIPTTFMQVIGRQTMNIHANTEITRENKGLELALVLDTTGSMSGSALTALKSASTSLINTLFGNNATGTNLWVGIVPFAHSVNIGSTRTGWLDTTHFNGLNWGTTSWSGCVDSRWAGNDVTAATPATQAFQAYYYPDDSTNDWITSNGSSSNICLNNANCNCTTYSCGCSVGGSTTTCLTCYGSGANSRCTQTITNTSSTYSITSTRGPNAYCPSTVTPLTNVKATVQAGIDALVARGGTHIPVGMAWGWRMLDPGWRGLWGGVMNTNNLPLNYNTPLMLKAVVLMTDGENTMYNDSTVRTSYGFLSQGRLGTTSSISTAEASLNTKLSTLCTSMKAQGIIVYTILFNYSDPNVATLLRNCATQPDYYFSSPNSAALQSAFQQIGASLANLRISQ
jgi:Flp pilus assembly protein TadG